MVDAVDALIGDPDAFQGTKFAVVQNGPVLAEKIGPPGSSLPGGAVDAGETTSNGQFITQAGSAVESLPSITQRHSWIIPSLSAATALIVLILGWQLWLVLHRRRR